MAGPCRKVTSCSLTADESERIATLAQRQGLDDSITEFCQNKVGSSKCLGVEIVEFLTWNSHITSVSKKVSSGIGVLKKIKPFVPVSNLTNLTSVYQSIVEPYFDYCSIYCMGWHWVSVAQTNFKSCKIVLHVWPQADYRTPITELLSKLGWSKLKERRNKHLIIAVYICMEWHRVSVAQKNFKSYKVVLHVWPQADYRTPTTELLSKLGWSKLKERRNKQKAVMMFKIINGQNGITPVYLEEMFSTNIGRSVYNVRTSRWNLALPAAKRDSWLPEKLCLQWGQKSGMYYLRRNKMWKMHSSRF